MGNIIVTITNSAKRFFYDIEVPSNLEIEKLKDDIVETLNAYNSNLLLNTAATELYCNRINEKLQAGQTLETAGVWNGDYITILEV